MANVKITDQNQPMIDLFSMYNLLLRDVENYQTEEKQGALLYNMAVAVFQAFTVEAIVNYVGTRKLGVGWPERASFNEKMKLLIRILELDFVKGEEPLQTIHSVMKYRNELAHPKYKEPEQSYQQAPSIGDVKFPAPDWLKDVLFDKLKQNDEQIREFQKHIFCKARIDQMDFYQTYSASGIFSQ